MSDLISRQAAMAFPLSWEHRDKEHGSDEYIAGVECYRDYIEGLPSAQQEVSILTVKCELDDEELSRAIEDVKNAELELIAAQQEQRWIPVSERLPENTEPVNITWVNRKPEPYYADIKDKPFTATGHYCNGKWWWYSAICQDYLDEYGECKMDEMDGDIEVIAWMPLPPIFREE